MIAWKECEKEREREKRGESLVTAAWQTNFFIRFANVGRKTETKFVSIILVRNCQNVILNIALGEGHFHFSGKKRIFRFILLFQYILFLCLKTFAKRFPSFQECIKNRFIFFLFDWVIKTLRDLLFKRLLFRHTV